MTRSFTRAVYRNRGRGRGRGRGQGREGEQDPFFDTKVEKFRGHMDNHEDNEQPRQGGQNQILEELFRANQQILRQGELMMDMM